MAISLLTLWADGLGALVAVPPAGKMSSGWLGDEQPPADWENWINKTLIDKINEMIPGVNNGIDMVNGGTYNPLWPIIIDYGTSISGNPSLYLKGSMASNYTLAVEAYFATSKAALFGNLTGKAARIVGEIYEIAPVRAPLEIAPLLDVPTTMIGGDLAVVNGSLVYYDKTSGQARMARSVSLASENLFLSLVDMNTNETAGVRDWNFAAAGIPSSVVSRNARPCYCASFPLIGRVPYYNVYLSSIRVQLTPGTARANQNARMNVLLMDMVSGAALSSISYDSGTNTIQYVTVPCNLDLDFTTQNPVIIVNPGTTNGIDTIHNVRVTFNGRAL